MRILRKKQVFHTRDAKIDQTFNSEKGQGAFTGFPFELVEAYYRKENPCDGEVTACIFELSQADLDFFASDPSPWPDVFVKGRWLIWFPKNFELKVIQESKKKTNPTTEDLLHHGWPDYQMLHHYVS